MKSMRYFLLFILVLVSNFMMAQDKVYLNDNTLLEGVITIEDGKEINLILKDKSKKNILKTDIALIIYENGYSQVVSQDQSLKKEDQDKFKLRSWTVGTNLLLPLDGKVGFTIEKNLSENYSIRLGETFSWSEYPGLRLTTSILNNFYVGKGRVKWLNSMGLNINYLENSYYYFLYDFAYQDLIWPGPPEGFQTSINLDLTIGTGVNIHITKHLAFSTQLYFSTNLNQNYSNIDLDLNNSGFSFYYKF